MLLFANKARSALTGSVTAAAGQVAAVTTGTGVLFVGVGGVPTSTQNPMRCVLTAVDANGNDTGAFEVVEVVRVNDNLTLQSRGLEGTTAAAWSAGTIIECRPTAGGAARSQNPAYRTLTRATDGARWLGIPGAAFGTSPGVGLVPNKYIKFTPMVVSERLTITEVRSEVTTIGAAGAVLRSGVYNTNDVWQPTTLVADFGTVDVSALGVKVLTPNLTLQPGNYLIAWHANDDTYRVRVVGGMIQMGFIPENLGGTDGMSEMAQILTAYGALPSDGTTASPQYFNGPSSMWYYYGIMAFTRAA